MIVLSSLKALSQVASVHAAYKCTSSQSMIINSVTRIKFNVKETDTHNAYDPSTGFFTAPLAGVYQVSAAAVLASGTIAQNASAGLLLLKNGNTEIRRLMQDNSDAAVTWIFPLCGSASVLLNAGDTISIGYWHNIATRALDASGNYNWLSIFGVGS